MGLFLDAEAGADAVPPSAWVQRFAALVRPGGSVLDVACGSGRNLRWLAAQGFAVTGVDRDVAAVEPLRGLAEIITADIENAPWPLPGRRFDAVVVANYLWRPLWPVLHTALADGGVLLCETFAHGQASIGKPSRPAFLLAPGELLQACAGLRTVAFEDGFDPPQAERPARHVQRIAAVRETVAAGPPPRYPLQHPLYSTATSRPPGAG